ncbi:MAG: DUF2723 domain-containing protein [Anaerolineae bacterium]|nr:DUF2723 domain-containing protein [Anaerolineae bacterium]
MGRPGEARPSRRRPAAMAGLLVLLAAGILYALTLDNGLRLAELQGGDLITHQYAQVQARPSNAPGYPLYTMGGWLWFRLGRLLLGQTANPVPILSSYSTFWALLALALLYLLCLDVTWGHWPLAALCTAFYAVTYFFWYYGVTTEQYTSAVAQTLAMVWLAFRWEQVAGSRLQVAGSECRDQGGDRYLLLLALLTGIGLAHMVTVLLIVPPLVWFVLRCRPDVLRRPGLIVRCAGLALLPLLSYLFVYVRGAQHPEWRGAGEWPSTWAWFWQFVSTAQGRQELTWALRPLWTSEFPSLIWGELTWAVLVLGLVGIRLLGRQRAALLYTTLGLYFVFCWVDRLGNWYQVIMPAYPLVILGLAAVTSRIWWVAGGRLAGRMGRLRFQVSGSKVRAVVRGALIAGLLALIACRFALSYPRADSSNRPEDDGLEPGRAILADAPAARAAVLGNYGESVSLRYLTDIWGLRPDVTAVSSAEARRLLAEGSRPVYVTVSAAPLVWSEVSSDVRFSSAGLTLVALRLQPQTEIPTMQHALVRDLGDNLRFLGYDLQPERPSLALYWQATGPIIHDWSISVRPTRAGEFLFDERGLIQFDHQHPVHGLYPTSGWVSGEVVRDDYALSLPSGLQADGIVVMVYRPVAGGFQNLGQVELAWPP